MPSTDRWEDDDYEDRDRRGNRRPSGDGARAKTPGLLLTLAGIFMLLWCLVNVGVILSGFDTTVAILEFVEDMQPVGKQKDDLKKQIAEAKQRDKTAEYIQNGLAVVIGLVMNTIILIGGSKMKGLQSYKWSMAGAICALIPCNSCCCIGFPIGLWALIVLLNKDVQAAFPSHQRNVDRDERDEDDRRYDDDDR